MDNRDYIIILYDYYYGLFNDRQREYFESYYFDNLSLSEISDNLSISRNAIHKMLRSMVMKLYFYEEKLGMYKKYKKLYDAISKINDDSLKDNLINILESE